MKLQLSAEFNDLTNWLMQVTKNEMSFQPDYDYDVYDAHTGWKIALFKPDKDASNGSFVFQLIDDKNKIGTQVCYTIKNDHFLISSLAYWDGQQEKWHEDNDPYDVTHKIWNQLKNWN